MDKPKFIARTHFGIQNIQSKEINKQPGQLNKLPEFNITGLTLQQLGEQLQKSLTTPRARFFKGWQNRGAELDVEYQRSLLAQINNLREINAAFVQFQAEAIISYEMIEMIIANKRAEVMLMAKENALRLFKADKALELAEKEHKDALQAIEDRAALRNEDVEGSKLENLKKRAEIAQIEAQTFELKNRATVISNVLETVDFKTFDKELLTYIVISLNNPNVQQYNDFSMMNRMQDLLYKQQEEKTKQEEAKTKQAKSQADIDRTAADKVVIDFKERHKK